MFKRNISRLFPQTRLKSSLSCYFIHPNDTKITQFKFSERKEDSSEEKKENFTEKKERRSYKRNETFKLKNKKT